MTNNMGLVRNENINNDKLVNAEKPIELSRSSSHLSNHGAEASHPQSGSLEEVQIQIKMSSKIS